MTRWMRGYRKAPSIRRVTHALHFQGVPTSPLSDQADWPSVTELLSVQDRKASPPCSTRNKDGLVLSSGRVWIPDDADNLKLRLLTIAHAGCSGHRGADPTWHAVHERFTWRNQRNDVRAFVSACLLCVLSKTGSKIPRPLATTAHASKPN